MLFKSYEVAERFGIPKPTAANWAKAKGTWREKLYKQLEQVMVKELAEKADNRIDSIREITSIQCSDGNWNYDPYMQGMANGMIFALSIMENKEPVFLDAPDVWGEDKPEQALKQAEGK